MTDLCTTFSPPLHRLFRPFHFVQIGGKPLKEEDLQGHRSETPGNAKIWREYGRVVAVAS